MNPGGEPERDDTGLPPVDIEIPDDARELDRDVQSYYRELRAQRRSARSSRLRRSLTRDGIALPLLACCLIFALITGTLLTVFTASGIEQGLPGTSRGGFAASPGLPSQLGSSAAPTSAAPTSTPAASSRAASPRSAGAAAGAPTVRAGQALPSGTIKVDGKIRRVRALSRTALLLVPAHCGCGATITRLTVLFSSAHVTTVLVSGRGVAASDLAAARRAGASLATDPAGTLRASYPHAGLTAVLIGPRGAVHYAEELQPDGDMTDLLPAVGAS